MLDRKKTLRNLLKKGFIDSNGDHKFLNFYHDGKLILHTKISHGSDKEIGDPNVSSMAKQCKLKTSDFIKLATCTMSEKQYIAILIETTNAIDN